MTVLVDTRRDRYHHVMAAIPAPRLFPFLVEVGEANQTRLSRSLRHISCQGGTQLVARGDLVAGAYLVERGALRVYYVSPEGREGTLYWVEPGQSCILALNCMFSRLAYPAWVESEGPTEFSIVPGDVYRDLFAVEPAVQRFTFEALSGRLFELMALIEETASQGLEARISALLLRRAKGQRRVAVTQEQLARHLTTSREVVSRVLRRLAAQGLIESGQGWVTLLDLDALQRLTD
jgi:CRP/FNR family transcriptional regulator